MNETLKKKSFLSAGSKRKLVKVSLKSPCAVFMAALLIECFRDPKFVKALLQCASSSDVLPSHTQYRFQAVGLKF